MAVGCCCCCCCCSLLLTSSRTLKAREGTAEAPPRSDMGTKPLSGRTADGLNPPPPENGKKNFNDTASESVSKKVPKEEALRLGTKAGATLVKA